MYNNDNNIFNSIENLYNINGNSWREVLATMYNNFGSLENAFRELETNFGLRFPEEVKIRIEALIKDGTLGDLINSDLLGAINKKVDDTDKKVNITKQELSSQMVEIMIYPTKHGAKGDGLSDDTLILQDLLNKYKNIDLEGKTYKINSLNVLSNRTIKNGKFISDNAIIFNGNNIDNIKISNVTYDGNNIAETAIKIENSSNITIENCEFLNLQTQTSTTCGIYLKKCVNSNINSNSFNNIVGIPNSIIGDGQGASRAICIEESTSINIEKCNINNIISTEDGDGIQIIGLTTNANICISQCNIKGCSRRAIKCQQNGITIQNNVISDCGRLDSAISVYSSNVIINSNIMQVTSAVGIGIGSNLVDIIKDVAVMNNTINLNSNEYQACIVIQGSKLVQNISINNNALSCDINLYQSNILIRGYIDGLTITNNKMTNGEYGIFFRGIKDTVGLPQQMFIKNVIINNNDFIGKYTLVYTDEKSQINSLNITNNIIFATSPLSYALNTIRCGAAQLDLFPIIQNNIVPNNFIDGIRTIGTTSNRPTNGMPLGFMYNDTTINKPIWWNGTNWRDSTGTIQ